MSGTDYAEWAKAEKVCFDTEPLLESSGGGRLQVGFILHLYARAPMDIPPGEERRKAGLQRWEELRKFLEAAVGGAANSNARLDIEPMRAGGVMRPENELEPEVMLTARIEHPSADEAITPAERDALSAFTKKLVGMGLRPGHW